MVYSTGIIKNPYTLTQGGRRTRAKKHVRWGGIRIRTIPSRRHQRRRTRRRKQAYKQS